MDGRAQAGRQRRGTCPKIVAREVREASRIQSTHSLASSQLSLGRDLINHRAVSAFGKTGHWADIGRMTKFDPKATSIGHQFNLNTSLSKAFTASCVARVELGEYAACGSFPTQLSP